MCQATKPKTNKQKIPIFPIAPEHSNTPFGTITMDFITKLPESQGNDTILTITDYDCSKAALLFPCKETIMAKGVAKLYAQHVFPHYRIPSKIISDRDPRFTEKFWTALCQTLDIQRNLSTAFHPQTDKQSERTNQWTEQYLQIFGNTIQTDWAEWLPITQYVHNSIRKRFICLKMALKSLKWLFSIPRALKLNKPIFFLFFCFKYNSDNSYPICMLEGSFKSHEEGLCHEYIEPAIILHFTISS